MKKATNEKTKDGLPIFEYTPEKGEPFKMVPYSYRRKAFQDQYNPDKFSIAEHLEKHDNMILIMAQLVNRSGEIIHNGCWGSCKLNEMVKDHAGMASIRAQHSLFGALGIGVMEDIDPGLPEDLLSEMPTAMGSANKRLNKR